jgi:hypothetical protein
MGKKKHAKQAAGNCHDDFFPNGRIKKVNQPIHLLCFF